MNLNTNNLKLSMTELDLIIDLHKNSDRQGPGSEADTLKALEFMNLAPNSKVKIADIGCGSGGQTITLAKHTNGHITAVDLFPQFLSELDEKAGKLGLTDKIKCLEKSMDSLPFEKEEFDIIWSEGAIYNIGFEKGVVLWRDFLKKGGYLALSEITWISESRPKEIQDFWTREYPEIDTASNKINILRKHGYSLAGYFELSAQSWMEHYYTPLAKGFKDFLERNKNSDMAKKVVSDYKAEIEMYNKYKKYYSYGFYVAKKD